jgi:hypothetical protein
MAEEKKEKWMNYMALTTVIIAVCATFSTFKGGGYGTRSLMNQTLASDRWSQYQSKSIKSYIFEMQRDNLGLQKDMLAKSGSSKEVIDIYQAKIDDYNKKIKKFGEEKDEIAKIAKGFESEKELSTRHSWAFGFGVIFLQISILLSSISALTKRHYIYFLSLAVGLVGILYFLDGWFLFFY